MNELTIQNDLQFRRVSKAGKVTTRGALGVMLSGNRAESASLGMTVAEKLIANNTFAPIMAEVARVFAPKELKNFGVFEIGSAKGHYAMYDAATKTITPLDEGWNVGAVKAYAQCVVKRCAAIEAAGKEVKGEKAHLLALCEAIIKRIEAKEQAKIESQAAGQLRRAA